MYHQHLVISAYEQPMQRGNFSLGPCGGFNYSTSKGRVTLEADTEYNVLFQQHLNHYYLPNPGKLNILFVVGLDPPEENFRSMKIIFSG
jgi:hypothetical protein